MAIDSHKWKAEHGNEEALTVLSRFVSLPNKTKCKLLFALMKDTVLGIHFQSVFWGVKRHHY